MNGIADLYRLAEVSAGTPAPMMVFPVGDWTSDKYPKLSLTQELADELIANFEADVLRTRVPIDANHDPKSPANGWVERLYMAPYEWNGLSGEALYADWTPNERGASAVNGGDYAYDSLEIGAHTDPVSGAKHENVLKAISLTNRPVLRMMPPVAEAGESLRLAEPLELALSEVVAADAEDPAAEVMAKFEEALSFASEKLKGKAGIRDIRTYIRAALSKASAHKLSEDGSTNDLREELSAALHAALASPMTEGLYVEDFGPDWVIFHVWKAGVGDDDATYRATFEQTASGITLGQPVEVKRVTTYVTVNDSTPGASPAAGSTALSHAAKATEGQGTRLAEGHAAGKGVDPQMKSVIQSLKLSEDADESAVLAAVMRLSEERDSEKSRADAAELRLAEAERDERVRAFEAKLAEATSPDDKQLVHILPGERDTYLALAEIDHDKALAAVEARMKGPGLKLGANGVGSEGDSGAEKRPDIELTERTRARMGEDTSLSYSKAMRLVLSEDADLATRYENFQTGKGA